ncbi:MAG: PAS domain-containing protein [Candidatus Thermoplasmatota archaeon]
MGPHEARDPAELTQRWLVDAYAPAAVVIDPRDQVTYTHGAFETYVKLPRGEPVLNLLSMVSPAFRARLRAALHKSRTSGEPCELTLNQPVARGATRVVRSRIHPLGDPSTGLTIVTFEDVAGHAEGRPATAQEESAVHQLEAELVATKGDLQGTIEALETANEELRASNEEIMSMNEEFRSTNEELETSKEELQSLNEELTTVNNQLREKIQALELVTNDLTNLLASTDIPTLFLDSDLRIRRFTPASKAILSLIPSDLGRPLSDISMKFQDDSLLQDIQEVGHSLAPAEKEIRSNAGKRFLRRIRPYRTHDNRIDGVVITFVDIETMKLAEDKVRAASRYAEDLVDTVREPLLALDERLRVKSANRAFYEKFQVKPAEVTGRSVYSLGEGQWDLPALRELLKLALHEKADVRDFEVEAVFGKLGKRTMLMNSRRLRPDVGEAEATILLAIEDVTERVQARADLEERVRQRTAAMEEANRDLRHVNESLDAFSHVVGHDLKEPARAVELLLQMLQQDHATALPTAGQKLLTDARAANERLSRLIMGLLALSRASRIDFPNLKAVGITEAIENETCRTRYEALLAERHGRIDVPKPDVFVHATSESLSQILGNLILNALKHNPRPKPRVRVRAGPAKEGDMVEVVVEDNGPGFPADLVVGFDDMSATTRGFGLIIVRRTVENLGGQMWLAKGEGGGAAVHFTLRPPAAPAS